MKETQSHKILQALRQGRTITALDALQNYGCMRLSSRIHDIKRQGFPVIREMITLPNGKRVAAYSFPPYARWAPLDQTLKRAQKC